MSDDLFKRPKPSMAGEIGDDLASREAAAAEKAVRSTATITSSPKGEKAEQRNHRIEAEMELTKRVNQGVLNAVNRLQESEELQFLLESMQKTVTFNDLELRALIRRIHEQGYRSGFLAGVRYAQ